MPPQPKIAWKILYTLSGCYGAALPLIRFTPKIREQPKTKAINEEIAIRQSAPSLRTVKLP
jgi:hypothetical protein